MGHFNDISLEEVFRPPLFQMGFTPVMVNGGSGASSEAKGLGGQPGEGESKESKDSLGAMYTRNIRNVLRTLDIQELRVQLAADMASERAKRGASTSSASSLSSLMEQGEVKTKSSSHHRRLQTYYEHSNACTEQLYPNYRNDRGEHQILNIVKCLGVHLTITRTIPRNNVKGRPL